MIKRFRVFWFISLPSIIFAAVTLLYYPFLVKPKFNKEIIKNAKNESVKVGAYFIDRYFSNMQGSSVDISSETIDSIKRDISIFGLWKVRFFNTEGKIIFSSEAFEVGKVIEEPYFKNIVAKGRYYSKVVKKANETELDAVVPFDIVETYIPICSVCKKIRDDKGYWEQVEIYVKNHTEASFSYGYCPDCYAKEIERYKDSKNKKNEA
ncbi:MAG: hypothetical protein ACYTFY_18500 [Planctomycetota bacterium]|jgi:hypothetical protein